MASSLQWRLTGGAANSDPNASLGGVSSSETLSSTALNNLFDNVSWQEAVTGDTEYRALDLYNAGDATAYAVTVWFDGNTSSADTVLQVADGGADASVSVADESTAPTGGLSFITPTEGAPLSIANIAAGHYRRIWFKRVVNALASNVANDTATLKWQYA